jgi:hypothetical protein
VRHAVSQPDSAGQEDSSIKEDPLWGSAMSTQSVEILITYLDSILLSCSSQFQATI